LRLFIPSVSISRRAQRMDTAPKNKKTRTGIVTEALPDTLFRVELDGTNETVLAYLAGKMRMNRIRVLVGDKIELEEEPYGGKARIVRRF
jgi:translation initiation factor IF-1